MIFNVLYDNLHLKPFKYHDWHKKEPHDYGKTCDMICLAVSHNKEFPHLFRRSLFLFNSTGNKQNNRTWAANRRQKSDFAWWKTVGLVWNFIRKNLLTEYFLKLSKSTLLSSYHEIFFGPKHLRTQDYKKYYFQQDDSFPSYGKLTANMTDP